jgi:hypothetical protein
MFVSAVDGKGAGVYEGEGLLVAGAGADEKEGLLMWGLLARVYWGGMLAAGVNNTRADEGDRMCVSLLQVLMRGGAACSRGADEERAEVLMRGRGCLQQGC